MVCKKKKYMGVCNNKNSGMFEAHVWISNARPALGCQRAGYQLYVGCHREEDMAARARDLAALKFRPDSETNFPREEYEEMMPMIERCTNAQWVTYLKYEFARRPAPGPSLLRRQRWLGGGAGARAPASARGRDEEEVLWVPSLVPVADVCIL
jgi:hypothetical protein